MLYRMIKITRTVSGTMTASRASARFSLSYSPDQPMAYGSPAAASRFCADLFDRVFDGGSQIAASHVKRYGDIAAVAFTVDVIRAILDFHTGQLCQRYSLPTGRKQANIRDRLAGIAIGLLITRHHVVPLFADQHLAHRVAAHGGLDSVLYDRHVDSKPGRLFAVNREIEVRLTEIAQQLNVVQVTGDWPT